MASSSVKRILVFILSCNLLVLFLKLFIGIRSSSISILGDALHSGIDSLNNIMALWFVKIAAEPPDSNHQYGHSKFETLGALGVVLFLSISSIELLEKSIFRFLNPTTIKVNIDDLSFYLLLLTLVINIFVWSYEKFQGQKLNSQILLADAEHTWSDILITISILISVFFIREGYYFLDPLLGIFVAFVIFKSAIDIFKRSLPVLVDEAWINPKDIEDIIRDHPHVVSYSDFKSRKAQPIPYLEMNLKLDIDSLSRAHAISHSLEKKIIDRFGRAQIRIHIEPWKEDFEI
jgi:cation diffusion facilitator family transporter